MNVWEKVKKFAQPYDDDYEDEYDDEEMDDFMEEEEPAPRQRRTSPFAAATSSSASDYSPASEQSSAPASAPASSGFSGSVLTMNSNKQEVVLFHATSFADASDAADKLRSRKALLLNMENEDKALTRRVVDFLTGCVYALEGSVKKVAQSAYLFCPHNMGIVGDLESAQEEIESYI